MGKQGKLRSQLSYANVMATIAVVLAVGGGVAWAALGPNTVGSPQIKRGAVKTSDIGASAVTSGKVRNENLKGLDVLNDTLTGDDILESSLAQVPGALNAVNATNAQNAVNATNADSADFATNAQNAANATNADNAANATNAIFAANASSAFQAERLVNISLGTLGQVEQFAWSGGANTAETSVYNENGLDIDVGCPNDPAQGPDIDFDTNALGATTGMLMSSGINRATGAVLSGGAADADGINIDGDFDADFGNATLNYQTNDGVVVVVHYAWEDANNPFGNVCAVSGYGIGFSAP